MAKEKDFTTLLVAGGSKTNASVLKSGKVKEIYLDVEPWLFNEGLPLLIKLPLDFKLELLRIRRIGKNGVQLHYQIKK